MILHAPEYYKEFKCIANKCKNNCCTAGWEIDIDTKTAEYYKQQDTSFQKNIEFNSKFPHFKMGKNGKCPFLNDKNLCDIYIKLGPDRLCQICSEHPRYYEWFNNVKEAGIGLCCEEAARIIISQDKKFKTYNEIIDEENSDEYDDKLYKFLGKSRKTIIEYLENSSVNDSVDNFMDKLKNILCYAYYLQEKIENEIAENNYAGILDADMDIEKILYKNNLEISVEETNIEKINSTYTNILIYFTKMEPNDEGWITDLKNSIINLSKYVANRKEFEKSSNNICKYLKNISIYFIWRYFLKATYDWDVLSKVKFMVTSVNIIEYLAFCKWLENGKIEMEDYIDIARKYSEEIEYCEENMEKFAEDSYNLEILSVESIIDTLC